MKKIIGLVLFSSLLIGCSNVSSNESAGSASEVTTSEVTTSEVAKSGFDFTSGVDSQNFSYADTDNYSNIEGISHEGNTIYMIYDGMVLDVIEPNDDGTFKHHNRTNKVQTKLVFSDDTNLSIGDSHIETSDLDNSKVVNVIPNEEYLTQSSSEESEESENINGINEEGMLVDDSGKPVYSIKITEATKTLSIADDSYSDIYTKGKPENTIEVTYEYKNYSYGYPIAVNSRFFSIYDAEGTAGEYSGMQYGQSKVPDGESALATTWFIMPEKVSDLSSIEISYGDDTSLEFEDHLYFDIPLD